MASSKPLSLVFLIALISCFQFHLSLEETTVDISFPLTAAPLSETSRYISSLMASPPYGYNYRSSFKYSMALIVSLPIGTPPQTQQMAVDTGSQLSWIQCHRKTPRKPTFDPSLSSSFSLLPCNHPLCKPRIPDFTLPTTCDQNRLCHYSYFYADGTLAEGNLVREKFTFSASRTTPPLILGCASDKTLVLLLNLGILHLSLACPICPYPSPKLPPKIKPPPQQPPHPPKPPSHKPPHHPKPPSHTPKQPPHVPKPPTLHPPKHPKSPTVRPPPPHVTKPPVVHPPVIPKPPPHEPEPPVFRPPVIPKPPPFVPQPPIVTPPITPITPITPPLPPPETPCPPPPPPITPPDTCPTLKLDACVDILGGLIHVGIGSKTKDACCPVLGGLVDLDAALCLCTTIKAKLLNINIIFPIALQLLVECGKTPPSGFQCSA